MLPSANRAKPNVALFHIAQLLNHNVGVGVVTIVQDSDIDKRPQDRNVEDLQGDGKS
jgi:hypothetical protein